MAEIKKQEQKNKIEIEKQMKIQREQSYQRKLEESKQTIDQEVDDLQQETESLGDQENDAPLIEELNQDTKEHNDDVYLSDDDENDDFDESNLNQTIQNHTKQTNQKSKQSLREIYKSKKEERSTSDVLKCAKQMKKEKGWGKSKMKKNATSVLDSLISNQKPGEKQPQFMKDLELLKKQMNSGKIDPRLVNNLKKMDLGF